MRNKKHSTNEIIDTLRSFESSGQTIAEFCRGRGISEQTFYRWRSKYEGMNKSEAKRLKQLEVENARLKKLVAERDLEIEVMKEIAEKKW